MHGFNNGVDMTKLLCQEYDFILLQEHWLLSDNLCTLDQIDDRFQTFKVSSMDKKSVQVFCMVGRLEE